MNIQRHLDALRKLSARLADDKHSLEDVIDSPTVNDDSNAPLHLAEMASSEFDHGMDATLLENEDHLQAQVLVALERVSNGTYGSCEVCGQAIGDERLEAIPFATTCIACARQQQNDADTVDYNSGRPVATMRQVGSARHPDDRHVDAVDRHAAGEPGGGSAVGGLAGSNTPDGEPDLADLQGRSGSSARDASHGRRLENDINQTF